MGEEELPGRSFGSTFREVGYSSSSRRKPNHLCGKIEDEMTGQNFSIDSVSVIEEWNSLKGETHVPSERSYGGRVRDKAGSKSLRDRGGDCNLQGVTYAFS
ncbi:MAG: hypothetical protein LUQ40_06320 [Methanomicrobiales archaeon]|nr:hypothetical protein [Methanomicrobiales archaeon]